MRSSPNTLTAKSLFEAIQSSKDPLSVAEKLELISHISAIRGPVTSGATPSGGAVSGGASLSPATRSFAELGVGTGLVKKANFKIIEDNGSARDITAPETLTELVKAAFDITELLKQNHQAKAMGVKSESIDQLIKANDEKVEHLFNLLKAAILATETGGADEAQNKVSACYQEAKTIFSEINHSLKSYATSMSLLQPRIAEAQHQNAQKLRSGANELQTVLKGAIRQYVETYSDTSDLQALEALRRQVLFGLDAALGGTRLGKLLGLSQSAHVEWVRRFANYSLGIKLGMGLLGVITFFPAIALLGIQYWSYGLGKLASALSNLSNKKEGKPLLRLALRMAGLALGIAAVVGLSLIPGVNVAVISVGIFVIAPMVMSAWTWLTRGWQDYAERSVVEGSPLSLKRGKSSNTLEAYEVSFTERGQQVKISLDPSRLNALLTTLDEMRRGLMDAGRKLSSQGKKDLDADREAILGGDGQAICRVIDKINTLLEENANRSATEQKPLVATRISIYDLQVPAVRKAQEDERKAASSTPNNGNQKLETILATARRGAAPAASAAAASASLSAAPAGSSATSAPPAAASSSAASSSTGYDPSAMTSGAASTSSSGMIRNQRPRR